MSVINPEDPGSDVVCDDDINRVMSMCKKQHNDATDRKQFEYMMEYVKIVWCIWNGKGQA